MRSISSTVFGVPAVSTSEPSAVISTSSSMRTPIPKNSFGIGWTIFGAFAFSSSSSLFAVARPRGREPGQLRAQHDFVDRALRGGEAPVDGEGTGDVRRVVAPLAAGVDQEQLAVLHLARVPHVVEDARVGPRGDDRGVRVARRALAPEDELERRLHLVR